MQAMPSTFSLEPVVIRNGLPVRAMLWLLSVVFLFLGGCMACMVLYEVFVNKSGDSGRWFSAAEWAAAGAAMIAFCVRMWGVAGRMGHSEIVLEQGGVKFQLGTKKQPSDLFMAWQDVKAVTVSRVGRGKKVTVDGRDGSNAVFNSYTFLRPEKVARMIAERAGMAVQRG